MLSAATKHSMLTVIIPSVVVLSVVAPRLTFPNKMPPMIVLLFNVPHKILHSVINLKTH